MATSGSIDSGGYQGRVLRFEWGTNSTNPTNNTRVIWYKVTAIGGSSSIYYHHSETIDVNGTRIYTGSESHAVTTNDVLASGTLTINQGNTTTLTVDMHGGIYDRTDNINTTKSWTLDTLVTAPTINSLTLKSRTINSLTFAFTCTKADTWYYKLLTSSSYTQGGTSGVTSGEFTISNLSPNTSYTINFIARNWAGSSAMDATKNITSTTYDIGKIASVNNFNHGDNAVVVTTNPSGSSLSLTIKVGNTQILSQTVATGTNTINFSDTVLDNIYKLYGSSNTLTATFILTTAGTYTNSQTATITLTGNQKTIKNNVNGIWKRGKMFVNINGTWKKAVIWLNINGTWKRGI